jgi:hypothetical protein
MMATSYAVESRQTKLGGHALDVAVAVACAIAGAAFAWAVFTLNHRAFFNDDTQEAFAPMFMAIGQALAHGHWPALTLQMLNGGALVDEYQFGLFNPFTLFASLVISPFKDQALAEALFVGLHYAVLASGAYVLARNCGANRPFAALAAVTFLTNNFICYWLAGSWVAGLEAFAWMTWALAFLVRAHESRVAWVATALATAMVMTVGCYHVVVMLGMAVLVVGIVRWRMGDARQALLPVAASALGVLLAMAAILPVLATGAVAIRNGGLNNEGRLAMDLYGVLAPSSPFHFSHFLGFGHFGRIGTPFYFAGWYILPLLPLIDWRKLGRPTPTLVVLAILAVLFVVATQGPEQVFSIRFPIWYLPALHLMLLTAFSVIATQAGFARPTRPRIWGVVLITYFGWLASLQGNPETRAPALAAAVAILSLVALGAALSARWKAGYAVAGLIGTGVFAATTHIMIPANGDQFDRHPPTAVAALSDLSAIPTTSSAFLGTIDEAVIWKAPEIQTAAMALAQGGSNPFGYSPVGHRAFSYKFLLQLWGTPLPQAIPRLFQPTDMGGLAWADLLRIDKVVIPRVGERPAQVAALAGPGWRRGESRPDTVTLIRTAPAPRGPGSVAWTSPGLSLAAAGPATAQHETLAVRARSGHGDKVVFDRLAWPGYRVTLAGRPVAFSLTKTPLMTVDLPDGGETGPLAIDYAPPYLGIGIACALLALAGLTGGVLAWSKFAGRAA